MPLLDDENRIIMAMFLFATLCHESNLQGVARVVKTEVDGSR
jgi:hypothetical protein